MSVDTKAIRAQADAATEGPWGYDDGNVFCEPLAHARRAAVVAYCDREPAARDPNATFDMDPHEPVASCPQDNPDVSANEEFIAAARTDVPALCDRVEALEKAISNLIAVIDRDGGHAQAGDVIDECRRAEAVVLTRIVRAEALEAALRETLDLARNINAYAASEDIAFDRSALLAQIHEALDGEP
jgi:hypothetical protein